MKRNCKRLWRKAGNYWFCYLGHRRWWSPQHKGRIYYRQKDGSFFSHAPKNNGGLKGLKSFWRKRMKAKGYKQKGHFDFLSYYRANGR